MGLISNLVLFKTTDFDFPQFFLNYCKDQDVDVFYHEDDGWLLNINVTVVLPVRYKDDLADVIVAYSPHPDDFLQYLKSFMIDDEYLAKFGRDKWEDATKEILDQVNRYKDVNVNGEGMEKYFSENNYVNKKEIDTKTKKFLFWAISVSIVLTSLSYWITGIVS